MDPAEVKNPDQPWTSRVTIPVIEAGTLLGIGRSAAYQAVRTGQIPSIRIGRRVVVPVHGLRMLLEGRER